MDYQPPVQEEEALFTVLRKALSVRLLCKESCFSDGYQVLPHSRYPEEGRCSHKSQEGTVWRIRFFSVHPRIRFHSRRNRGSAE